MKNSFIKSVQTQLIIFFVVVLNTVYAQGFYQVIDLGTFGGSLTVVASSINNSGVVAGYSQYANGNSRAFLWQNGTMTDIGTLGGNSGAFDINDLGQVVGESYNADGTKRAFLWQNGNMIDLGAPGGVDGGISSASGINNSTQIVGFYVDSVGTFKGILWDNGSMIDLGHFGGHYSAATKINNSGQIVGYSIDNTCGCARAFLWQNGNMMNLGTFGGSSYGNDINDSGHVVGYSQYLNNNVKAFLWKNGVMTDLGSLGGNYSFAAAINDFEQVVGTSIDSNANQRAYIWQNNNMTDLNDLIDPDSGWVLTAATSINKHEQIVGYGTHNGEIRAFLLIPHFKITKPQPFDKWIAGETDTIKWTETEWTSINVRCITNFETPLQNEIIIAQGAPVSESNFEWDIPEGLFSYRSKIIVENANNISEKVESDIFRIKPYILTRINPVDSNYYEFRKNRDQWGFSNTLNNMWPPGWWLQFNYNGTDPFTNSQYSQWQVDEAFKSANHATHSDWVSWVNTFSVDAYYYSTSLGIYKSAAVLAWKSSGGGWGGSCFGIAVANALAFRYKDNFQSKYPNFPAFLNPITVVSDTGVKRVVNELYTHQFGSSHLEFRRNMGLQKTPKQTLIDLLNLFTEDNAQVRTLSFNNNGPGGGGHAILAYGLEKDIANPNIFYIKVYDNSNPNSNNRIIIDTSANGGNGSWVNPDWPGWGGNKWIYLRNPTFDYLTNPAMAKGNTQQSPFIINETELQVFNTISASIRIVDNSGNITGFYNNLIQTEIPESVPLVADNGSETPPYGYSLPGDNYSVILNEFEEDTVEAFFFTGYKSFLYERYEAEQNETDRLFFDGGVSVSNPDAQTKTIKLLNLINETTQEKLFVLRSLNLVQNDSIKIENPDSNKVKLISYGSAKDYDIELNYVTENGISRFGDFNITLSENTSHTLVPDWTNISNSELQVLVDIGNDGNIDDTLSLKNEVTGIKDEGSVLTPDKYNLAQNYPNPFNPTTTIQYSTAQSGHVSLKVYDVLGNEVATLVNEEKESGVYTVSFDAAGLSTGVYFYKLKAGNFIQMKKMLLIK